MDIAVDELMTWKQLILSDKYQGKPALDALDTTNHDHFVAVCRALLDDLSPIIRLVALMKLGQRGDRDDIVAQNGALQALNDEALRDTALFALGRVGTPEAFPLLFSSAVAGSSEALKAASKQVRTTEQRNRVLELAREDLCSYDLDLRDAALGVLMQHSTITAEQEVLLRSAEIFTDDFVFVALEHASGEILPRLYALREKYPFGAEHKAIARTIARIENQQGLSKASQ